MHVRLAPSWTLDYNIIGRFEAFCCGLSGFRINLTLWQSLLNSEACHKSQYILIFVRRADLRFTLFWVSPTRKFYSKCMHSLRAHIELCPGQYFEEKWLGVGDGGVILMPFEIHKSV